MPIAAAGFVDCPAEPNLYYELLPIASGRARTIRPAGVHIGHIAYNADVLYRYRKTRSPYPDGRWPIPTTRATCCTPNSTTPPTAPGTCCAGPTPSTPTSRSPTSPCAKPAGSSPTAAAIPPTSTRSPPRYSNCKTAPTPP
jgi:hypothetical protein